MGKARTATKYLTASGLTSLYCVGAYRRITGKPNPLPDLRVVVTAVVMLTAATWLATLL